MIPSADDWRRLDARMLLIHPLREVARFWPALVGLLLAGRASGSGWPWELLGIGVPLALGVARFLTTSYRVATDRVELRTGLLQRQVRTAQLDRVRTIGLTSTLLQRLLGLTTVRIGTGAAAGSEGDLDLDGLPREGAERLREDLLRRSHAAPPEVAAPVGGPGPEVEAPPATRTVVRLDPSWARYAPLTSRGLVASGALLAVGAQVLQQSGAGWTIEELHRLPGPGAGWLLLVVALAGLVLVVSTVLSVAAYLTTSWDHTLTHQAGASGRRGEWRLSRGLTTTQDTSVTDDRVAGIVLLEPLGLRLAGAARSDAVVTGLGESDKGTLPLVPAAPRRVAEGVADAALGAPGTSAALRSHGPAAVRRRWVRAGLPAVTASVTLTAAVLLLDLPVGLLVIVPLGLVGAAALARDRSRSLGHTLLPAHLVTRAGSLERRREALALDHVIGWTLRDTWWQRRAGLTTLVATTAGGRQRVEVLDVPEEVAVALVARATPTLADPFLSRSLSG